MTSLVFSNSLNENYKDQIKNISNTQAITIHFRCFKHLTVEDVRLLQKIKRLAHLKFSQCNITDDHLQALPTTIESLTLKNCHQFTRLDHLAEMPNLKKLELVGCRQITDEMLSVVPQTVKSITINASQKIQSTDERIQRVTNRAEDLTELVMRAQELLTVK